jgi:hypothetical protein
VSNLRVTAAQTLYNVLQTGNHTRYVAQAESSLAAGRSELAAADSNYLTSRANYRQVIVPVERAKPDAVVVILKAREPARIMIAIGDKIANRWHLQIANRRSIQLLH